MRILLLWCFLIVPLTGSRIPAHAADFFPITGPCHLKFPEDHDRHPGYRVEWWYYTGNVETEAGRRFGFQLTFFRYQLAPSSDFIQQVKAVDDDHPTPDGTNTAQKSFQGVSAWRTNQLYFAHAAITDIKGKHYLHAEDVAREALGMAGVRHASDTTEIFLKDWSATIRPHEHRLMAKTDDFSLDLMLKSLKMPVLHGDRGYTRKGASRQQASCYYSFTRLETTGTIALNGDLFKVTGFSWMDHEFSSAPLDRNAAGWDWFSLQMDDDTELMVYVIRMKDGTLNPASSATFVRADGRYDHFMQGDFDLDVLDTWKSPHSGGIYPARWRLSVRQLGLDLMITPGLEDQEMQSPKSTGITYWEGSAAARGTSQGKAVSARGYVELTGYVQSMGQP